MIKEKESSIFIHKNKTREKFVFNTFDIIIEMKLFFSLKMKNKCSYKYNLNRQDYKVDEIIINMKKKLWINRKYKYIIEYKIKWSGLLLQIESYYQI